MATLEELKNEKTDIENQIKDLKVRYATLENEISDAMAKEIVGKYFKIEDRNSTEYIAVTDIKNGTPYGTKISTYNYSRPSALNNTLFFFSSTSGSLTQKNVRLSMDTIANRATEITKDEFLDVIIK